MDAPEIEKLKALALAATSGPWELTKYGNVMDATNRWEIVPAEVTHEDRLFIAEANPATVLALIAEVERLRADAERWKAFRARDEFRDLDYTAFQDQFREDADAVIDAAIEKEKA